MPTIEEIAVSWYKDQEYIARLRLQVVWLVPKTVYRCVLFTIVRSSTKEINSPNSDDMDGQFVVSAVLTYL